MAQVRLGLCVCRQVCLSNNVCSDSIRTLTAAVRTDCTRVSACGAHIDYCNALTMATNPNPADVMLYVRTHDPYTTASGDTYMPTFFEPPLSPSTARWVSTPLTTGSKTLILWSGTGYDGSAMALLIGAVAGGHRISLNVSTRTRVLLCCCGYVWSTRGALRCGPH